MGKNRHSKDRMFITATEWATEYGGKKTAQQHGYRPLPFTHCAISLSAYETPCCTAEGVLFDLANLVPYVMKHKKNPVTGAPMSTQDIIRLNMAKNNDDEWHCPVTCKVFNNTSHVVAIKTSGNVFAYDAVNELNIKSKNFTDLLTGEKFTKADIITLQDIQNAEHMALRDINNFVHMQQVRDDAQAARETDSKVRHNPTAESVMKELEVRNAAAREAAAAAAVLAAENAGKVSPEDEDVADLLALRATTEDVDPGRQLTSGKAGSSLTSSSSECWTGNAVRLATAEELRGARWRKMKQLSKKGYVQLQTTQGNLNIEIHCDWAQRPAWNFLTLCEREYYDGTKFHRLVPGFMVQGGDPSGTGSGGDSAWGKPFRDSFDSRLLHDARGIVSMANSGPHTNGSQFFVTLKEAKHLDYKHSVFGKLVGGAAVLDRIEEIGADKKEVPYFEIKLVKAVVFTNPIAEANQLLIEEISENKRNRLEQAAKAAVQFSSSQSVEGPSSAPRLTIKAAAAAGGAGGGAAVSGKSEQDSSSSAHSVASGAHVSGPTNTSAPARVATATGTSTSTSSAGGRTSSSATASASSNAAAGQQQADKIAAFLRSHQASDSVISTTHDKRSSGGAGGGGGLDSNAPASKVAKKSLSDFSSW